MFDEEFQDSSSFTMSNITTSRRGGGHIKPFRFQNVDILHFKGIGDLALEAEVMDISSKTSRPDHFFQI